MPLALAVFRDGLVGAWQPATMKTATTFELQVVGPYEVVVQCDDPPTQTSTTMEWAYTPDDPHDLTVGCAFPTTVEHTVTGQMVQAGAVLVGDTSDQSSSAGWAFSLQVPSGTFDLMATTDSAIALRRGIAVTGDLALSPSIDVAHEGAPLVDVGFSITNSTPSETLSASVNIDNASLFDARVYLGPIAGARVAPDSVLVSTDKQSASLRAVDGSRLRALRRPFRVGDDSAYTLPAPTDAQLAVEHGQLVVSWTTLIPQFDTFWVDASSYSQTAASYQSLDVSPSFVATTGVARLTLDTDIPGYQAAWKVDLAGAYDRSVFNQRVVGGDVITTELNESVNAALARGGGPPAPVVAMRRRAAASPWRGSTSTAVAP